MGHGFIFVRKMLFKAFPVLPCLVNLIVKSESSIDVDISIAAHKRDSVFVAEYSNHRLFSEVNVVMPQ